MGGPEMAPQAPRRSERPGAPVALLYICIPSYADVVVVADALQHEERRRARAWIGDQTRAAGASGVRLAGMQTQLLLGIAEAEPELSLQHVEGVLDVRVVVPRHLLRGRDLQLADPEARPLGVTRTPLHLVESARILDARHHDPPRAGPVGSTICSPVFAR